MNQFQNQRRYDLEERTKIFALQTRSFLRKIPKTTVGVDDIRQLVRSSGSIGANYIEANESLGKKDFLFRLRIALKEAKETIYWLHLIEAPHDLEKEKVQLLREGNELMRIFGAIVRKLG